MRIEYAKAAVKYISGLDRPAKQRLKAGIEGIPQGDIKPLKGSQGSYRLRVGDLRVIFSYPEEDVLLIERVGPRGDVYKGGK